MQFQQRGAAIPVRLDAMVASLEDCELEGADVGPAWEMLRSVLIAVAHQFLGAAESGAYETRSVIGIVTLLLQGGLLGLRGNDCLEANGNTEGLGDILDRFDLVLLERLKDADRGVSRLNGSEGDIRQIVAAAYQFQSRQRSSTSRSPCDMATRLTPALAILAIVAAACGGATPTPVPLASDVATAEPAVTYPRPAPLADLPLVELVGPAMLNAGPAPVFEWEAVDGAVTYRLSVRGPDGFAWAWQGTETAIRYGGVAEAQQGPTIVPGTTWSVAALAGDASLVALSERRLVSPTDDRGPAPDATAAERPAASAAATPEAATPVATGPCSLLTGDEITAAIEGTWGPPDEEAATGVQGICTWTSANGTPLTLYVAPADQYDPDGWGADETLSGLGDQAYRVTKGWDRRIGFVSGDASVMLTIDYTKVDAEGFVDLARLVESRLP